MLIKVSSAIFAQVNQNATNLVTILKGGVATIIIWTKQARMYDQEIGGTILAALESVNHLLYFSKSVHIKLPILINCNFLTTVQTKRSTLQTKECPLIKYISYM